MKARGLLRFLARTTSHGKSDTRKHVGIFRSNSSKPQGHARGTHAASRLAVYRHPIEACYVPNTRYPQPLSCVSEDHRDPLLLLKNNVAMTENAQRKDVIRPLFRPEEGEESATAEICLLATTNSLRGKHRCVTYFSHTCCCRWCWLPWLLFFFFYFGGGLASSANKDLTCPL